MFWHRDTQRKWQHRSNIKAGNIWWEREDRLEPPTHVTTHTNPEPQSTFILLRPQVKTRVISTRVSTRIQSSEIYIINVFYRPETHTKPITLSSILQLSLPFHFWERTNEIRLNPRTEDGVRRISTCEILYLTCIRTVAYSVSLNTKLHITYTHSLTHTFAALSCE